MFNRLKAISMNRRIYNSNFNETSTIFLNFVILSHYFINQFSACPLIRPVNQYFSNLDEKLPISLSPLPSLVSHAVSDRSFRAKFVLKKIAAIEKKKIVFKKFKREA